MSRPHTVPAWTSLAVALTAWATAPVVIRLLSDAYDPYTQAFLRYAGATVILVVYCWVRHRADLLALLRRPAPVLGLTVFNILHQAFWTIACYGANPTIVQLISCTSVIFVTLFSFMLFHEERAVIRNPRYLLGTALGLVGVMLVISPEPGSLAAGFNGYTFVALAQAILWSAYSVGARHLSLAVHPVPMFTATAVFTSLGFIPVACVLGEPQRLITSGGLMAALTLLSAVLPIAVAHPAYHYGQKYLGSAFSSSLLLVMPLLTYGMALAFLPDQNLVWTQWIGAGILSVGALLVILTGPGRVTRAVEERAWQAE